MSCDFRDNNTAVCVDHALLLPSAEVGSNDFISRSDHLHPTPFYQQAAFAQMSDFAKIVRHEYYRCTTRDPRMHALDTLALEEVVADTEHFIHKQDIRIDVGGHREAEAGEHARRIPLYWHI